jgi:transcriptional regulator with XRE-family HTH domain
VRVAATPLRGLRQQAGLTQAELAERLGGHQPNVSRAERGVDVPLSTVARHLAALGAIEARIVVRLDDDRELEARIALPERAVVVEADLDAGEDDDPDAYVCLDCEHRFDPDDEEAGPVYCCDECGVDFTPLEGGNRCPECNRFSPRIADARCPECESLDVAAPAAAPRRDNTQRD